MQVDEVLVSSSDVDLAVATLFDSDEIFLRVISLTSPSFVRLAYRMRMVAEVLLY